MALTVATRCRVLVDNDLAGDPDGLVALAHHLLSPGHRVDAVTTSRLSPLFGPPDGGAAAGAAYATELVTLVGRAQRPDVAAGHDVPFVDAPGVSAAAATLLEHARREDPLPLVLVCGGPLTNVAEVIRADPGVVDRFTLAWVGGSVHGAAEYNHDTDPEAAELVLGTAGLRLVQFPLETYRQCAWSVAQLEDTLASVGPLGAWLWRRFVELPLPPGVEVDAVWPLGDSCPVVGTALSGESSVWEPRPAGPGSVCTRIDTTLLFADLVALLRRHAARPV